MILIIIVTQVQILRTNFLSLRRSKVNQAVDYENLLRSRIHIICLRSRKRNGAKYFWIGPTEFQSRVVPCDEIVIRSFRNKMSRLRRVLRLLNTQMPSQCPNRTTFWSFFVRVNISIGVVLQRWSGLSLFVFTDLRRIQFCEYKLPLVINIFKLAIV